MIRRLRVRHRRMIVLLAVALPLLFAAALSVRRPIPRMERLPQGLVADPGADPGASSPVGAPRVVSWEGGSLRATVLAGDNETPARIRIELLQELTRPGLLVYWSGAPEPAASGPPDDALLLGSLAGRHPVAFRLPAAAAGSHGQLILFSPTQGEMVTSFRLPATAGSAGGGSP